MNKIELKIKSRILDLNQVRISLVYKNPVFNENSGSFSYDFDIPIDYDVNVLFNFPSISNRKDMVGQNLPAELYFNSHHIISGDLILLDVKGKSISVSLGFAKGSFNYAVSNLFLNKIGFLEPVSLSENPIDFFNSEMVNSSFPEQKFCLPSIYNEGGFEFAKYHKHKFVDIQNGYNTNWPNSPNWPNGNGYQPVVDENISQTITPMIFLREIYTKFAKFYGFEIIKDFFDDGDDLNSLIVYSNLAENYEKDGNEWYFDLNKYIPEMKWNDFSQQINETFNTVWIFNNREKTLKIIGKNELLNITTYASFENEKYAKILSRKKVEVSNGHHYFYDFSNMNELFEKTIVDIFSPDSKYNYRGECTEDFISSNSSGSLFENHNLYDVYFNTDLERYISFEPWLNWNGVLVHFKEISINEKRIISNDDDFTEVKQRISPIVTGFNSSNKLDAYEEGGTDLYQQPFTLYNSDIAKINKKLVVNSKDEIMNSVILLFYRGLVSNNPYANTDVKSSNGIVVGNKSLHAEYMYDNYWKTWLDWYYSDRDEVDISIPLTSIDFMNVDYENPYRFSELGITGFIDSIEVDLETNEEPKAKIRLFLV